MQGEEAMHPDLTQEKIQAEIAKLIAETAKIINETKYYPMIVLATIIAASVALIATLAKLL